MTDAVPAAVPPEAPASPRVGLRRGHVLAALAALGVVVVLALGPAAALAASRVPLPAPQPSLATSTSRLQLPQGPIEQESGIREVPVGLPRGTRIRSVADVRPYAVEALGPDGADRLLALLPSPGAEADREPLQPSTFDYPYRFVAVDEVVADVPTDQLERHGAALGGALLLLAAEPEVPFEVADDAARVAFAVLDRARRAPRCEPQLNMFVLVASDPELGPDTVQAELRRTQQVCPQDQTPGWLAAQRTLKAAVAHEPDVTEVSESQVSRLEAAVSGAAEFVRRFPRDPGALSTLGDAYLIMGQELTVAQPFTAREAFQDAATVFERLRPGEDTVGTLMGAARAQLGLARAPSAAQLATRAVEDSGSPGLALQLAVTTEEKAREFDRASAHAKRLASLGPRAFPAPTAIAPLGPPLSWGSDSLAPLTVRLIGGGQGDGAVVSDEGFIPTFRKADDLTETWESCPDWVWRRDALVAGDARSAASAWPDEFSPSDPANAFGFCPDGSRLKALVDTELDGALPTDTDSGYDPEKAADADKILDDRQNLLRWAGDLAGARRATLAWAVHLGDDTALALQRLGEIDYLLRDDDAAAAHFAQAAERWRMLSSQNDLAVHQALLGQGAALLRAGRSDEAVSILRPLVLAGAQGFGYQRSQAGEYAQDFAAVSYYASALLGNHELAVGHDRSASEHFAAALLWADTLQGVVHLDALRNSAAISALGTGDRSAAIPLSRAAVSGDPRSPVYLMTSAGVAYRNGNVDNAIREYRAALETDESAYPAANNLGVHLAHQGHLSQAARALRTAVQANPAYALGWYNLGIVEGRRGPLAVVVSQGALARAVALDPSFADRPPRTALDTATYRTGLDVSKPLPAGWSFAESQRKAPAATVGLLAVVLAGVGLARLRGTSTDAGTGEWLGSVGGRLGRLRGIRRIQGPWWAVIATVAAFLLAFWREPLWPWTGIAYAVGLVALVGAGMLARALVARRSASDVVHGSWPPGVLVGLVSGAFGSPIAPLPVVRSPAKDARVAIAAPLTLAVLGLVLLLESAWLHTPLTTSLGVAAFIMAGSLLIPVKPLDGARAGRAGVVGAVGLLGALLLLGLGLV